MPAAGQVDAAAAGGSASHTNRFTFILQAMETHRRFLSRGLQQSGLFGDLRGKTREERMEKRPPCRRFLQSGRTLCVPGLPVTCSVDRRPRAPPHLRTATPATAHLHAKHGPFGTSASHDNPARQPLGVLSST